MSKFKKGDRVEVICNGGGQKVGIGANGVVTEVYGSGNLRVAVGAYTETYAPSRLKLIPTDPLYKVGDKVRVKDLAQLERESSETLSKGEMVGPWGWFALKMQDLCGEVIEILEVGCFTGGRSGLQYSYKAATDTHPTCNYFNDELFSGLVEAAPEPKKLPDLTAIKATAESILHHIENVERAKDGRPVDTEGSSCSLCDEYYGDCQRCPLSMSGNQCNVDDDNAYEIVHENPTPENTANMVITLAKSMAHAIPED